MTRPTVAHHLNTFLWNHGTWVYPQLVCLRRYRAIVLCKMARNLHMFPFSPIYDVDGHLSGFQILWARAKNKLFGSGAFCDFFCQALRKESADVIHAHFGIEGVAILPVARKMGLPLVTAFYGRDASCVARDPSWLSRYQELFQQGATFLAEGPFMKSTLVKLGCPSDKVIVQHLGVDLNRLSYRRRTLGTGEPIQILVAAAFVEKKGIEYAIRAFHEVHRVFPNTRLRIVGDGPLRPQIEEIVADLDLSNTVVLLGELDYPSFCHEMDQAHLFLSPSVTASDGDTEGGCPVSIIEAQALGLPVLATYHADIPEVVVHGETGLLAPERDVPKLVENLAYLVKHPHEWERMGRTGRARVEWEFDANKQVTRLEEIYDAVRSKVIGQA